MNTFSIMTLGLFVVAPLVFLSGCAPEVGAESFSDSTTDSVKTTNVKSWSYPDNGDRPTTSNTMPRMSNTARNNQTNSMGENISNADDMPRQDNTARNHPTYTSDTLTSGDQSETSSAIRITAAIRRAVVTDGSLSTNAKNCKIITDENGRVALRGVVKDQAESDSVALKATLVAGAGNVDNQLKIASSEGK